VLLSKQTSAPRRISRLSHQKQPIENTGLFWCIYLVQNGNPFPLSNQGLLWYKEPMHDPVKWALGVGGISLAIALFCGVFVAWINGGSRNIGLGLGALLGACVLFLLQIIFDLKSSSSSTDFAIEFVTDYQNKEVRSPSAYAPSMAVASRYGNLFVEAEASKAVAVATPSLTKDDAPKISRDLAIVSILSFLLDQQSDWQIDTRVVKTSLGTTTQWMRVSTPKECSLVDIDTIRKKLKLAGNMFADVSIGLMREKAFGKAQCHE
jgi:hypothetical protein